MTVSDSSALAPQVAVRLRRAVRRREAVLAGHQGDETAARAAFVDPDPQVRRAGLGALVRMGALTSEDFDAAVGDESPLVRRHVGELARSISQLSGRQRVVSALKGMLDDEDATLVEASAFGIGEAGLGEVMPMSPNDKAALDALCNIACGHPDTLCRESAVVALGGTQSAEGLRALLHAMGDKPAVRRRCVISLGAYESDLALAAIERALSDRDWQVRQAAQDMTGATRSGATPS